MTPEIVVEELVRNGYRKVPQPLHVAELNFDFSGALTGPNEQDTLTLVLEGEQAALRAAQRRLRAFTVVSDRAGSARPITVVIVGDNPNGEAVGALEELARVVIVRSDVPLQDSLFTLLPLSLPDPVAADLSAGAVLKQELAGRSDAVTQRLLRAAKNSAEKVRTAMHTIVRESLEPYS